VSRLGYRALLRRYPDYRRLWLGGVVSFLGDWFNTIALYTAVGSVSDDARAIAGVMVAKMLPPFLISPVAGPIVDRFERRRLLIVLDVVSALAVCGIIVAHRTDNLWAIYAGTVVVMTCSGIAFPTKNAVLRSLVPPEHVPAANALSGGTWSVMLAFGATLGGVAVAALGVDLSLGIDALTFGVSALFFIGLPRLDPPERRADQASFVDGLRYLWRTPYVLALSCIKPALGVMGGMIVLIPLFGIRAFPESSGPLWIGVLYGARGLGALVGSMGLRLLIGDVPRTLRRAIVVGFFGGGMAYATLSLATSFWHAALCYFAGAVASGLIWVYSGTLLQLEADRAFHGRIFALEFGVMTLMISASSWLTGEVIQAGVSLFEVARIGGGVAASWGVVGVLTLIVFRRRIKARVRAHLAAAQAMAAGEAQEMAMQNYPSPAEPPEPPDLVKPNAPSPPEDADARG
jgi:MFS family permease